VSDDSRSGAAAEARRRALVSPDVGARLAALEELAAGGALDERDVLAVLACLGVGTKALQRRAADVLCAADATTRPLVLARLRVGLASTDVDERWGAAYTLGRLGVLEPELLPALLDALAHHDGDRRWAAAALLVGCGERHRSTVVPALLGATRGEPSELRRMALYVLRDLAPSDASVAPAFLHALDDGDATVRLAALSALARLGAPPPEACARVLRRARDDSDAGVRRAALSALGRLGAGVADAETAIAAAERADDPATRRAAAAARRQLARSR
jgi:HEAT repeat protein